MKKVLLRGIWSGAISSDFHVLKREKERRKDAPESKVNKQVVANIQELLASLPTTSPYWPALKQGQG